VGWGGQKKQEARDTKWPTADISLPGEPPEFRGFGQFLRRHTNNILLVNELISRIGEMRKCG
jgi:hypothetical protein